MKIPLTVAIFAVAIQTAAAGVFQLPKDNPILSVEFSDKWQMEVRADAVTGRGLKGANALFAVFAIASAKDLDEALTAATERFKKEYSDLTLDAAKQFREAGMDVSGTGGMAKNKNGVDVRMALFSFSPDGQHYFGATWACDEAAGPAYGNEIDTTLNSIKPIKKEVPAKP
jgi:hypothetical protein